MHDIFPLAVLLGALLWIVRRILSRSSIRDICGPEPESFWLGNLKQFFMRQAGEGDFELQERYGRIARLHGSIGGEYLWVADPKALQHIYQASGYNYAKQPERRALSRLHSGHGLVWAEGEVHRRQRKIMLPAFGAPESKALLPHFIHIAESLSMRWKDILLASRDFAKELDVTEWLSRATMDAIGEAAFDCQFGALDNGGSEVLRAYNDLLPMVLGVPTTDGIWKRDAMRIFNSSAIVEWIHDRQTNDVLQRARECEQMVMKVAKELVSSKAEALVQGKGSRDIFSLLVKANAAEDAASRLSDEEMYAEMRTILLAGHETTAMALSWALLELAQHPEVQSRLREEVRGCKRGEELSAAVLDSMPYLQAVLREVLRVHPPAIHNFRQAVRDDVLPLAHPITTKSGSVLTELPIQKGTRLILSIAAYNRDPDLWGSDPHMFDPDRWLDGRVKKGQVVGMYGNLLSFSAGVRGCIGWRFAIYEMQAFLVELVSNFEFGPTEDLKRLRREPCGVVAPMLEGEQGVQLPLRVSLANYDV